MVEEHLIEFVILLIGLTVIGLVLGMWLSGLLNGDICPPGQQYLPIQWVNGSPIYACVG